MASRAGRLVRASREVSRATVRGLRGLDLALYAAGLTFYAALGLVPLLLVAVRFASVVVGADAVASVAQHLGHYTGTKLGINSAIQHLARAGTRLSLGALLATVVPGSLYAEGFVRALDRFTARGRTRSRTVRGRLLSVLLFFAASVAVAGGVAGGEAVFEAAGSGIGGLLLGIYLSFLVGWVIATALLLLIYRVFSAEKFRPGPLLLGAATAGSFLSGMTQGFLLVLQLAGGVGTAYGGSIRLGAGAVVGFLLYLAHLVVLIGYALTLRLDERAGARHA